MNGTRAYPTAIHTAVGWEAQSPPKSMTSSAINRWEHPITIPPPRKGSLEVSLPLNSNPGPTRNCDPNRDPEAQKKQERTHAAGR